MSYEESNPIDNQAAPPGGQPEIDPYRYQRFMEQVKADQNLLFGFLGGLVAAFIGAVVWAAVTIASGYQLGLIAIAIGFLVGYTVRSLGKGINPIFGIMGGGLAFFGCLLGNFFIVVALLSQEFGTPMFEVFSILLVSPSLVVEIMTETFDFMDLLFYGIAIYEGYKLSFRQISEAEVATMMSDSI